MLLCVYFKVVRYVATFVIISKVSPTNPIIDCAVLLILPANCHPWTNSYPWCILCQDLGLFNDHFIVQGLVFFEQVWLLDTPGEFYASMHLRSCDLKGGGGVREAWLDSRLSYRHCRVMCSGLCKPNLVFPSHDFIYWSSVSSEPSYQ